MNTRPKKYAFLTHQAAAFVVAKCKFQVLLTGEKRQQFVDRRSYPNSINSRWPRWTVGSGKRRFSLCLTGWLTELMVYAHSHFKSRDLKFTSKCAEIANFTRGYLQTLLLCSKSVKVFELSEPNKCTVLIKRWKCRGRSTSFSPRPIITNE